MSGFDFEKVARVILQSTRLDDDKQTFKSGKVDAPQRIIPIRLSH